MVKGDTVECTYAEFVSSMLGAKTDASKFKPQNLLVCRECGGRYRPLTPINGVQTWNCNKCTSLMANIMNYTTYAYTHGNVEYYISRGNYSYNAAVKKCLKVRRY